MDFDHILLQQEQRELLEKVVEASRNVPREQRQRFLVSQTLSGASLHHGGLGGNNPVFIGDIEALANEGLINLSYASSGSPRFDVTPLGYRYYEHMKLQAGSPVEQVEDEIGSYIDAASFRERYPTAYAKWHGAQKLLWVSDSENEITMIGHLCREAMQEFAEALVLHFKLKGIEHEKARTISRLRAVLDCRKAKLGRTHKEFLDALLPLWGAVSDLVQRQEHGAERERDSLKWEDARRVAFQTLIVMYEIDRALFGK
jgi:hypothetical protein